MAREGLRTLVVAKKILSLEQYTDFEVKKWKFKASILCYLNSCFVLATFNESQIEYARPESKDSNGYRES